MKRDTDLLLNTKGFTLIETVVAMTILFIVIAALLNMVSIGIKGVISSGVKSNSIYAAQSDLDNAISNYNNSGNDTITINFPTSITVMGSIITTNELYTDANGNQRAVPLVTFVPNQ